MKKHKSKYKILFIGVIVLFITSIVCADTVMVSREILGQSNIDISNLVYQAKEKEKLKVMEIKLRKIRERNKIERIKLNEIERLDELINQMEERKRIAEIEKKEEEKAKKEEEAKRNEKPKNTGKPINDKAYTGKHYPDDAVGRVAFLTFDDGPSHNNTPKILDILDDYNIKATFFVIGEYANAHPELIRRIYNEGHMIGNHSYSHRYDIIYSNPDNFMKDVYKAEKTLKNILGEDFTTRILRFPGGSHSSTLRDFRKRAVEEGFTIYDWNALNGDSEGHNIPGEVLIKRLKSTIVGKPITTILMHDTQSKVATVETLPEILDYLIQEGYEFDILR